MLPVKNFDENTTLENVVQTGNIKSVKMFFTKEKMNKMKFAIEMFNITLKTVVVALNCGGAKLLSFKNLFVLIINFQTPSPVFVSFI